MCWNLQANKQYPLIKQKSMSAEQSTNTTTEVPTTNNQALDFGKNVGKIASMMQQEGGLSKGDLAELRRISPDKPFTPALWRTLILLDLDESPGWIPQEQWERRWATLFMAMAYCTGLHSYDIPFGQALAKAGWSELRFVQLMRAEGQTLEKHLRRVAEFLSSKNQEANWTDAAWLLFHQSGNTAEKVRLNISRSYYSTLYAQEN